MASGWFDARGRGDEPRRVVEAGVLTGYFLSTYSARKLGLETTGNAGGSHNLVLRAGRARISRASCARWAAGSS